MIIRPIETLLVFLKEIKEKSWDIQKIRKNPTTTISKALMLLSIQTPNIY